MARFSRKAAIRRIIGLVLALLLVHPATALATTSVECRSADGADVTANLTIGTLPILSVLSATFDADGETFSTDASAGTAVIFGQGYQDDRELIADFTDPNVEETLVSLHIIRSFEGKTGGQAGVLVLPGRASFAVVCES